jgi:hypothetical protein
MTNQNKEYSGIEDKEYVSSAIVEAFTRRMAVGIKSVEFPDIFKTIEFFISPDSKTGTIVTLLIMLSNGEIIADRSINIDSKKFDIEWKKMLEIINAELVLRPGSSHKKLEYAKEHITT